MANLQCKKNVYIIIPLLAVLSLLGIMLVLFCTTEGIGISPDSTRYISAARNLLNGRGFSVLSASREVVPLTKHPLFPTLLAMIGVFGIDPMIGARWLNALLFGTNILLVGLVIYRYTSGSIWTSLFGSLLMLSSLDMINIHTWAWTEPLFILFVLLGLFLLGAYIENPQPLLLIASSSAIALAFLDRYAGIMLVPTGMAGLFFFSRKTYYRRIVDLFVFAAISCFPMALWVIRNLYVAGPWEKGKIAFHPITIYHIKSALRTFATWFLPWKVPGPIDAFDLIVVVVTFLVLSILLFTHESWQQIINSIKQSLARGPYLLAIFIFIYIVFLNLSISFYNLSTPLDFRILSPVYVSALVLILCLANKVLSSKQRRRFFQVLSILLCITFAGFYVRRSAILAINYHQNGRGYASKVWKESEIIQKVRDLPFGIRIYSNGAEAIYILTGKPAYRIPSKVNTRTNMRNNEYLSQLALMGKQLHNHSAVLVYFNTITWRWYLPSERELKEALPLRLLGSGTDGSIYGVRD